MKRILAAWFVLVISALVAGALFIATSGNAKWAVLVLSGHALILTSCTLVLLKLGWGQVRGSSRNLLESRIYLACMLLVIVLLGAGEIFVLFKLLPLRSLEETRESLVLLFRISLLSGLGCLFSVFLWMDQAGKSSKK